MTSILGISAFYHDAAAALVVDGQVVAAAQEERFTRRKHDARFPREAVRYCLHEAGLQPRDLDYVGFYDKPLLKFERLLETWLASVPRGYRSFLATVPDWMHQKLYTPRQIRRGLGGAFRKRLVFAEHHESHAASAFFPSPFEEAAVLTVDGVGEWATAAWGVGRGNRVELCEELRFPHSPGLLYSAFTSFCGFRVNSGEYKLMGLAPYGRPRYRELILEQLLDLKEDGSFRLNMDYFGYCRSRGMTSRRLERLLGGPARRAEAPITQREMDLAASIQDVIEEIMLRMARHVHRQTGRSRLCLAGGVALNCVANGRLMREGPFEDIWVQPAAGDAGGALGVAWLIWHQLLDRPRRASECDRQQASLLGPRYTNRQITDFLESRGARFQRLDGEPRLLATAARLLAEQHVVGWFQGRMEFGPRALGSRSILADARNPQMQSRLNRKIKFRESFRPFAPAVLRTDVNRYFDAPPQWDSPYMLFTVPVRGRQSAPGDRDDRPGGLEQVHEPRGELPAVTHVDYSARVQTVDRRHGRFFRLLECFAEMTGTPVLINTSFNVRGEPIVCTPADAYRCFLETDMDALFLEDFLLLKEEQPESHRPRAGQRPEAFAWD